MSHSLPNVGYERKAYCVLRSTGGFTSNPPTSCLQFLFTSYQLLDLAAAAVVVKAECHVMHFAIGLSIFDRNSRRISEMFTSTDNYSTLDKDSALCLLHLRNVLRISFTIIYISTADQGRVDWVD